MALPRLGKNKLRILEALYAEAPGELWGYEIATGLNLSGGSLYSVFRKLEAEDLIESRWEAPELAESEGRPRRRYYKITAGGIEIVKSRAVSVRRPPVVPVPKATGP